MPCMKCANGKYKYGEHGKCVYDTLAACKRAAAAIHIHEPGPHGPIPSTEPAKTVTAMSTWHDSSCKCSKCLKKS
jgi:hypothetical protein